MVEGLSVSEMGEQPEVKGESLVGDITSREVNITHGRARDILANTVTLRQGGVRSINAEQAIIRQGGVGTIEASYLEMTQGCLGLSKTHQADLRTSYSTVLVADGEVKMEQAGAQILVAKGDVAMDQSGALILVSRNIKAEHSGATFLIAREVHGDIKTTFGPRESLIFGTVAGIIAGLTFSVFRFLRRSK